MACDSFKVSTRLKYTAPAVTEHTVNKTEIVNQGVIENRYLYQHRPHLALRVDRQQTKVSNWKRKWARVRFLHFD